MTPQITSVDTSGLTAGIAAARRYSHRSLQQIVNTCGFYVACGAYKRMPVTEIQRIDQELDVKVVDTIGLSGKALKNKKTYRTGTKLAALIIQARANPTSKYNARTGGRYAITQSPFKGFNRDLGIQKMQALIDRMIKGRHSAKGFLRAGFIPAIKTLGAAANARFGPSGINPPKASLNACNDAIGAGIPAVGYGYEVYCKVINAIGTEGKNAESMHKAIMTAGLPALQAAVDVEGESQMRYAMKKFESGAAEVAKKHWS